MRIIHAVRSLDPSTGGPASVVIGLALAQRALGHEVIILQDDPLFGEEALALHSHLVKQLTQLEVINLSFRLAPKLVLKQLNADILHLHGVWCSHIYQMASQARRLNLRYVQAPHGTLSPWSLRQKRWKKTIALKLINRRVLNNAAFLHANNRNELDELVALHFKTKVELLPHGLSENEHRTFGDPQIFRDKYRENNSRPFILFLSRIAYQKGPDILLRAFEAIAKEKSDIDLVIAGPDGGMLAKLHRQLAALPQEVRRRIQLTGPLYGIEKAAAMRACSVFCLPSRYESFGMVLIEAMSAQCAIVCTKNCGFDDIEKAGAGLIVGETEEDLAQGLLRAIHDDDWNRTAGEKGRQLVEKSYLWSRIAQQLLHLYRQYL